MWIEKPAPAPTPAPAPAAAPAVAPVGSQNQAKQSVDTKPNASSSKTSNEVAPNTKLYPSDDQVNRIAANNFLNLVL